MRKYTAEDMENFRRGLDECDDAAWQKFRKAHEAILDETCPGWRSATPVGAPGW